MTISTAATTELTIDVICRRAMQLAGLIEPQQGPDDPSWASKSAMARDFLEADVEYMQSVGLMTRAVELYSITMLTDVSTYALASTTLDVVGAAMFNSTGETTQTLVQIIDRDRYQRITDKSSSGRPTMYYPDRGSTVSVIVWPVPDSSNLGTLVVQRHKALATATDPTKTLDFERYWTEYFMWSLAHKLSVAAGLPIARVAYMRSQSDKALDRVMANSGRQRAASHFHIDHKTGWN